MNSKTNSLDISDGGADERRSIITAKHCGSGTTGLKTAVAVEGGTMDGYGMAVQGSAERRVPGCVNAAGKARQE